MQGDSIRNITGNHITGASHSGFAGMYNTPNGKTGAMYLRRHGLIGADTGGGYENIDIGFDASRVVPTSNENCVINTAVKYHIRAIG